MFRYEFGSISVEDYFNEYKDAAGRVQLRRQITLTSSEERDALRFRLANSDNIKAEPGTSYRINNRLTIKVISDQESKITDEGLLYVPLNFNAQQTQKLVLEYLWE